MDRTSASGRNRTHERDSNSSNASIARCARSDSVRARSNLADERTCAIRTRSVGAEWRDLGVSSPSDPRTKSCRSASGESDSVHNG